MHRAAFTTAIARSFAEQFSIHSVNGCTFGKTVPMPSMRAGDIVIAAQCLADTHSNGLFADIEMRKTGHTSAGIEVVHLLFKESDEQHLPVHGKPAFTITGGGRAEASLCARPCC